MLLSMYLQVQKHKEGGGEKKAEMEQNLEKFIIFMAVKHGRLVFTWREQNLSNSKKTLSENTKTLWKVQNVWVLLLQPSMVMP